MAGEVVITQREFIQNVFVLLVNNETFSTQESKYLIAAMLEYYRALLEVDLPIDQGTQTLFVKYMIQRHEHQYLHMLLQYQSFADSPELAEDLFYVTNNGYPLAFQLVIDMYHRLKRSKDVIRVLLTANKVQEAVSYVEKFRIQGTRAKDILEAAHRLPEKQKHVYLDYFSKSNV